MEDNDGDVWRKINYGTNNGMKRQRVTHRIVSVIIVSDVHHYPDREKFDSAGSKASGFCFVFFQKGHFLGINYQFLMIFVDMRILLENFYYLLKHKEK